MIKINTKEIFRLISKKLIEDFQITRCFKHNGVRGSVREDKLKEFLKQGKLPPKYAIGGGEVISPYFSQAKQSDIIIYDRDKCPTLIYGDDDNNIFPIEGVYGIIEVKSKLSKQKLLEGLENIADFKSKVKQQKITKRLNSTCNTSNEISLPFGIIFAYDLDSNSLDSLKENYIEWKKDKSNIEIPNLIVVLNEGIIFNEAEKFKKVISSNELIEKKTHASSLRFQDDTLFEFYVSLYDLVSSMELGNINLREYEESPIKIGNHYVKGRCIEAYGSSGEKFRLSELFIERLLESSQLLKYSDVLKITYGTLPYGYEESDFDYFVYFYDPDNLPTLDIYKLEEYIEINESNHTCNLTKKFKTPQYDIEIDGEIYVFPTVYIDNNAFEQIK